MSAEQVTNTKQASVDITDWHDLVRYTTFLSANTDKQLKICVIDEDQDEVRLDTREEFETNVEYARSCGLKSLKLLVYVDGVCKLTGTYALEKTNSNVPTLKSTVFPMEKFQILRENILVDKWYIPVKLDEALGLCLTAAIHLAEEGKLDGNAECKQFIDAIVPEAFRKLQTTSAVFSWPREIQYGIFDMLELLVDLVGTCLCHQTVPITLLNTLAMTFDTNTTFSQKHKDEPLPTRRVYTLNDEVFVRNSSQKGSYGWLRSIIQRFVAQNGLKTLRSHLDLINTADARVAAMEYNALLGLFSKCHPCIEARGFRLIFTRPIRQAIRHVLDTKTTQTQMNALKETLIELCFNYEMNDEIKELIQSPSIASSLTCDTPLATVPVIEPTVTVTTAKKQSKHKDCYEQLAENIRLMTVNGDETERQSIKKQRVEEQTKLPLFSRLQAVDSSDTNERQPLSSSEKHSLKRKHRREQQQQQQRASCAHAHKKESKRSHALATKTYDRSDPADVLRFFAPMRMKIAGLYDDLTSATSNGNLRQVLKIEEKLSLLRPYSARFIADENTPDGTSMQPGQVFRKAWILFNDGSMPWTSDDVQLINLVDGIRVAEQPVVPVTAPHTRTIITVDHVCGDQPGTYESHWVLAYRGRTFGPMIWCAIEVTAPPKSNDLLESTIDVKEAFELIDVPLPSCFDLSKPYQSQMRTSTDDSLRCSSYTLPRSYSLGTQVDTDTAHSSDSDSLSPFMHSPTPILTNTNEARSLIELAAIPSLQDEEGQQPMPIYHSARSNQPLHFVDSVVTNIFSVAKHAGSTAKAIFNTLQATDELASPSARQTAAEAQASPISTLNVNDFFEHISDDDTLDAVLCNAPIDMLTEMGFVNRAKNQQLLEENNYDLTRVIEILTLESVDMFD